MNIVITGMKTINQSQRKADGCKAGRENFAGGVGVIDGVDGGKERWRNRAAAGTPLPPAWVAG